MIVAPFKQPVAAGDQLVERRLGGWFYPLLLFDVGTDVLLQVGVHLPQQERRRGLLVLPTETS
jgi:hypothetical protein